MRGLRPAIAVALSALPLLAAAPAGAATTIGQLAPGGQTCGIADYDQFNPTVTSGNSYVVPAGGDEITSGSAGPPRPIATTTTSRSRASSRAT